MFSILPCNVGGMSMANSETATEKANHHSLVIPPIVDQVECLLVFYWCRTVLLYEDLFSIIMGQILEYTDHH